MVKKHVETENLRPVDEKDRLILNTLGENARIKLTMLAKKVGLSIDSTKKRMQKLEKNGVLTKYTVQVNPDKLGLPLGVHIYLKLKNITSGDYEKLLKHLHTDSQIIDLMSMIGDYDLYVVMLARNAQELEKKKMKIRQDFGHIIADWKEVIVAEIYKLEEYSF